MNLLRAYIREAMTLEEPVRQSMDLPIPADLQDIHKRMKSAGKQLYVVGGAVRDVLLGKTPKDYDLATDAIPDKVIQILQRQGQLRLDLTGESFGVVRVKTPEGGEYEIATFREDIGKGRRPDSVKFTTIEDDVNRRDLTINALFYDMDTNEVVDYVGGISDIENGVIKAVGNPTERFNEDPLRILRAVRFAGRMGSDLDPETKQAILDDNTLSEVSPERIRDEFIKGISSAQSGAQFLKLTQELGLFDQIFPGLTVSISPQTTKDHIVQVAVLLSGNDDSAISSTLKKMKYTRNEIGVIQFLQRMVGLSKNSAPVLKKAFNRFDTSPTMQLEEFARLTGILNPSAVQAFLRFADAPPAADPKDLMAQGMKGPDIGKAMDDAEMEAYGALVGEVRMLVRGILGAGQ